MHIKHVVIVIVIVVIVILARHPGLDAEEDAAGPEGAADGAQRAHGVHEVVHAVVADDLHYTMLFYIIHAILYYSILY